LYFFKASTIFKFNLSINLSLFSISVVASLTAFDKATIKGTAGVPGFNIFVCPEPNKTGEIATLLLLYKTPIPLGPYIL